MSIKTIKDFEKKYIELLDNIEDNLMKISIDISEETFNKIKEKSKKLGFDVEWLKYDLLKMEDKIYYLFIAEDGTFGISTYIDKDTYKKISIKEFLEG